MSKERIQWIDNEKGFILLGVCLGHIGFTWNVFPYISSFHMAAFFFLSGMLFNPKRKWKEFAKAKCKNLLLPYLLLSIIFLLLSPSFYQLSSHQPGSATQHEIACMLTNSQYIESLLVQLQIYILNIINGHSVPYVGSLWFVYTLFQLNILWFFPVMWIAKSKYSTYILWLVAVCCFVLGWLLYMQAIHILFKIETTITSSAFFIGGFAFKKMIPYVSNFSYQRLILLTLGLAGVYYYGISHLSEGCIGYILNYLDKNIVAYFCVSWGGTWLLTLLFILVNRFNKHTIIGRILQAISLNGIAILALHVYITYTMKWIDKNFNLPIIGNSWTILAVVVLVCVISLPFINKYLYFLVGKKKPQTI